MSNPLSTPFQNPGLAEIPSPKSGWPGTYDKHVEPVVSKPGDTSVLKTQFFVDVPKGKISTSLETPHQRLGFGEDVKF